MQGCGGEGTGPAAGLLGLISTHSRPGDESISRGVRPRHHNTTAVAERYAYGHRPSRTVSPAHSDAEQAGQQHPQLASMPLLSASADTFVLGATICLIAFARQRPTPAPAKDARQPMYWPLITGILAIHTLYMIYILSFRKPPNVFERLHIPLSTSSQKIRATLLARAGMGEGDALPEHIEELLMKLNTFDLRTYFVRSVLCPIHGPSDLIRTTRFGEDTVQECDWCTTFTDYAAYTLPAIVLSYLREAALLGVVTTRGTNREMWRSATIGLLTLTCVVDVYWMLTARILIEQQEPTMVGLISRCPRSWSHAAII